MNIKTKILILINVILASCISNDADLSNCSNLQESKTIKINVLGKQYNHQSYQLTETKEKPFLYGLDIPNKTIDIFDLQNNEFHQRLDFSSEKLNINEIDQFYVHNYDSIFLYSIPLNTLYLLNSKSNLTNKWEFELNIKSPTENLSVFNVLASHDYYNGFAYENKSNHFLSTVFLFDGQDFLNEDGYNYPPIGRIQLTSDAQSPTLSGSFPNSYSDSDVPFDMYYSVEKKENNVLLNYSFSSKVYEEKSEKFYDIKSKYETEVRTYPKGKDPKIKKVIENINTGLVYLRTFDLGNGKLIRICKLPQSVKDSDGLFNQFIQSPWSVILYDSSTEKIIDEYCFKANEYDFRHVLPYENGFYVLRENPFDVSNNEDIMEIKYYSF